MSEVMSVERSAAVQTVTPAELVARSAALRAELVDAGRQADMEGHDTALGMRRAFEEGLNAISVPVEYGGISDGSPLFAVYELAEILTNLAAVDSSLAQNFATNQTVCRLLPLIDLPVETKKTIADRVLSGNLRLWGSASEAGSPQTVVITRTDGGVLVNGTKTFNTNSGGGGIAVVQGKLNGETYLALTPTDAPGVTMLGDWDNMGQRSTRSQSIRYENVFVPDGWHAAAQLNPLFILWAFISHSTLMLGNGLGAFDAAVAHIRATNRVLVKRFQKSSEDLLLTHRLGGYSAELQAALALQRQVTRELSEGVDVADFGRLVIDTMRVKITSQRVALDVTSGIFDLTGARTTANKHRFDRFWRNARTFASHDSFDMLNSWVGAWEVDRQMPDLQSQFH